MNGRTTCVFELKATNASSCAGARCAANARAAAIAPAIGLPAMLSLASTTSTTPKWAGPLAFAGHELARPSTGSPFSVTWTCAAVSEALAGSVRMYDLTGNVLPPASVIPICGAPAERAWPATATAAGGDEREERESLQRA